MYEFAYNDVIEDSHKAMRARERVAMDRVIGMLRTAQEKGPHSRERIEALFYLRRLWTIFIKTSTTRTMSCRTSSEPESSRSAFG